MNDTMNNAPPLPRGQMPIEEVFRMMWERMNYLENSIKEQHPNDKKNVHNNITSEQVTVNDLTTNTTFSKELSTEESNIMESIHSQEKRINEIAESLTQLKNKLTQHSASFNETIDTISSDLSEMNSKYTQMNNFLMEIQTTQITVNNQILRHYNENYNEMVETAIEKSASEKFLNKESEDNETDAPTNEEVPVKVEHSSVNESAPENATDSKTMTFNIE